MEDLIERVRSGLRRATRFLRGGHVAVSNGAPGPESLEQRPLLSPLVDILESDDEIVIRADTPGADPDNTWLYCDQRGVLSLHVRRSADPVAGREYGENLEGDWYRTLSLPDYVDGLSARATVEAGVMTIRAPKRSAAASVLIPVTAS